MKTRPKKDSVELYYRDSLFFHPSKIAATPAIELLIKVEKMINHDALFFHPNKLTALYEGQATSNHMTKRKR